MVLNPKQRRELIARGHSLKATVTIAADPVSESTVAHVRQLLAGRDLAKLRIRAESRVECEQAAAELAERVPCEVVMRVGRVVLLYHQPVTGA